LAKVTVLPLLVKDQLITPLDKVRDLGVIIDGELTMERHVRNWLMKGRGGQGKGQGREEQE